MLKLDNNLLDELGLGSLPEDQKRGMLQHIYETLELRVGTNLANQMTDQQLEEFEKFIDDGGDANQAQALQWLESNLPNYKQVVNEVFEALKLEVKQMAPQLVASSAQGVQSVQASQAAHIPQEGQPQSSSNQPMDPVAQPQPTYLPDQQSYQQPYAPQATPPAPPAYQQPQPGPQAPTGSPGQPPFPQQQPPAGPGVNQPSSQYPPQ